MIEALIVTATETYQPGEVSPEGYAYAESVRPLSGRFAHWSDGDNFIGCEIGQPLVITRTERRRLPDFSLAPVPRQR